MHRTKISYSGLIITGLFLIPITYSLYSNSIDFTIILLGLIALFAVVFSQFTASIVIEFHQDNFVIKYPLLNFLPNYKDRLFQYSDIEKIEYQYKIREPNRLEIFQKNGTKEWFWCRFRFLSNDKEKIGEIFNENNVDFQYRRFSKTKKFNEKEWVKMK